MILEQPAVPLNINLDESDDERPSKANGSVKSQKGKGETKEPETIKRPREVDDSDLHENSEDDLEHRSEDDLGDDPEDDLEISLEDELSPNEFDELDDVNEEESGSEEEEEDVEDMGLKAGPSRISRIREDVESVEDEAHELEDVESAEDETEELEDLESAEDETEELEDEHEDEDEEEEEEEEQGSGSDDDEEDEDEDEDDDPELPSDLSQDELDDDASMDGLGDFVDRLTARSKQPIDQPEKKDLAGDKKLRYLPSVPVPKITSDGLGLKSRT